MINDFLVVRDPNPIGGGGACNWRAFTEADQLYLAVKSRDDVTCRTRYRHAYMILWSLYVPAILSSTDEDEEEGMERQHHESCSNTTGFNVYLNASFSNT